ncbi:hypothetical protein M9458_034190, partial [Cirrhinus mrigala]
TVLVPGAVFHLYAAYKNIDQEDILEQPTYTVFYIISVLILAPESSLWIPGSFAVLLRCQFTGEEIELHQVYGT